MEAFVSEKKYNHHCLHLFIHAIASNFGKFLCTCGLHLSHSIEFLSFNSFKRKSSFVGDFGDLFLTSAFFFRLPMLSWDVSSFLSLAFRPRFDFLLGLPLAVDLFHPATTTQYQKCLMKGVKLKVKPNFLLHCRRPIHRKQCETDLRVLIAIKLQIPVNLLHGL